MPNEPSFFQRLTGSLTHQDEGAIEAKRVDFSEGEATGKSVPLTPAPQGEKSEEKREQWMEEAQEGQLTIDVYQTDTDIVIQSTVAGVTTDDLDISITNDMVTIRGKRERPEEVPQDRYFYQECYWGPFSRTVILPADIAADKAEATLKNGILTIRLPKVEKEQTKKIKVKPLA
jgi:HSP20 family protein